MLHTGVRAASRRWGVPCARAQGVTWTAGHSAYVLYVKRAVHVRTYVIRAVHATLHIVASVRA
eukprot:5159420-Prymnesium_polylepis.1